MGGPSVFPLPHPLPGLFLNDFNASRQAGRFASARPHACREWQVQAISHHTAKSLILLQHYIRITDKLEHFRIMLSDVNLRLECGYMHYLDEEINRAHAFQPF